MPYYKDAMSHGNLYIEFEVEYPKKNTINSEKVQVLRNILNTPAELKANPPAKDIKEGKKKSKT
jgi:DnaJ-class molecular chaperone